MAAGGKREGEKKEGEQREGGVSARAVDGVEKAALGGSMWRWLLPAGVEEKVAEEEEEEALA